MTAIKLRYLQKPNIIPWTSRIKESKKHPRSWVVLVDMEIELSDKYILKIAKGTIWDGASIPKWLWWLFTPIDEGALGDLIHDELWIQKQKQLKHFNYNIYEARKFADNERLKWRNSLAPKKKIKNWVTHITIRMIGGLFYNKQLKIPN